MSERWPGTVEWTSSEVFFLAFPSTVAQLRRLAFLWKRVDCVCWSTQGRLRLPVDLG